MNIGAVSQNLVDTGNGLGVAAGGNGENGSFLQDIEKALGAMNTVSLKDEQDALDLSGVSGAVASLIMSFYANGGNMIDLQDAQTMADIILGSDAMLDLLSYNEVTLNDIFLSNLNGGVLNGSESLMDKINNMDFSQMINAIKEEVSADINFSEGMTELIVKIMDEIEAGTNQKMENTQRSEANTLFDVIGKIRVDSDDAHADAAVAVASEENEQEPVIKTGQEDRIYTGKKTDYKGEVKDKFTDVKVDSKQGFGLSTVSKVEIAEITLEKPIESSSLVNSVLEVMQTSISDGKNSLFIKLKPDFLGGIAIKLAMSEDGVVAKIVTSSEKTQNMLANQLSGLETTLKEKGIDVARMEVLYNPLNQDGQGRNSSGQGQSKGGSSRSFVIEDIEEDSASQYFQLMGEEDEQEGDVYNA